MKFTGRKAIIWFGKTILTGVLWMNPNGFTGWT